jgi:RND family efflux transporter MFP subunit
MSERAALFVVGPRSIGTVRLRVLLAFVVVLIVGVAAGLLWRSMPQGANAPTSHAAQKSGERKVKYWWDPMMSPPFISDQPGKSPMGMDLVPVYDEAPASPTDASAAVQYQCPMHPNYISDHPGDCPICGMRLVPIKAGQSATASSVAGHADIIIDADRRQLIGVRSGVVERKAVRKTIRAVGRVEYDEERLSTVNLKVGGWVEELFVKSTGEEVHKGDPLFSLYSPELIEAERNYVLALQSAGAQSTQAQEGRPAPALATLRSARERLLLLDLNEQQIRALESNTEVPRITTIASKFDGVVTQRNIVQGANVEPGRDLYELADLSTVWVNADVYEYELPLVHVGLQAGIQLASQAADPLIGEIIFVYPYLNDATRTARVRIEVSNGERKLKPGMYATVLIASELGEQLVIDDQAVLDTGTRQLVFADLGEGRLAPREVTVGEHVDGQVVILKGLSEGERVVISGNFLVDSESRLKAALLKGVSGTSPDHAGHKP